MAVQGLPTSDTTNPSYLSQSSARAAIAEEGEKMAKVVSGEVTVKKKSGLKKVGEEILAEDVKEIRTHILWDVIVPGIASFTSKVLHETIDSIFGKPQESKKPAYTSYDKYAKSGYYSNSYYSSGVSSAPARRRSRSVFDLLELGLDSREDAETVLDMMVERTMDRGRCSVGTYYELMGVDTQHTDYNWGWPELTRARVQRRGDGKYVILLPTPEPLVDGL